MQTSSPLDPRRRALRRLRRSRWTLPAAIIALVVPLVFACIGADPVGPEDRTAPELSGGQPSGVLPAGTRQAMLSVSTNENATCRWGTSPSAAFGELENVFGITGGTSHSGTAAGLQDGQSYTYHVRCRDGAGNSNAAGYAISFGVASPSDVTAPVISGGEPAGTLPAGTTQAAMRVSTNEAATCRWGTSASDGYAALPNAFGTTGGTQHSTMLTGLADGQNYTRYVRCQDAAGNANAASFTISFSIAAPADVTAPVISAGAPSGTLPAGTTQATLSVVTNEAATCRWGTLSSATFDQMPNLFSTTGGTAHASTIGGLANGQSYTYHVRCRDGTGNANASSYAITFQVASPADVTPPVIGGGAPSGTLAAGTTQATMQVTTNEAASCRWGTSAGTPYASLPNVFATTGATIHTTTLDGLVDGQGYAYYVRCQDVAGNANTASYAITFSVASPADLTPPVISNGQPSGVLPAGTTQITMSVVTNEAASCRWGTSSTATYAQLPVPFSVTGGTAHSTTLTGLADGQSYARYVRCQDAAGNVNSVSTAITFSIASPADVTPPTISNGQPSGTLPAGTRSTVISVTTNEAASCRWGTSSTASYADLPTVFTTTGSTVHSTAVTGLADGQSYTYYVRCQDASGNASTAYPISFSVAIPADLTPPVISGGLPTGTLAAGTTQATMSVVTNEAASCRWGASATATYSQLPNTFSTTGGTSHSTLLTGLADGQSYAHYVRCQDAVGNANGAAFVIGFNVASPADATPPVISNGQPSGTLPAGTMQAIMSVATNESASCRWSSSPSTSYAGMANTFSTTGGTAHSTMLGGLTDGQSYAYYVRCQDAAGNANATSVVISFSIAAPADVTAPLITNGQPSGTLAAGTTQATMSVATNEAATCRWGTADVGFANLPNAFATTGGTAHSTALTDLADGQSYTYHVRCQDGAGNANPASTVIAFQVAAPADVTPPVISNGQPTGTLPAGTASAVMSVSTNESASCRWGGSSTAAYADLPEPFATTGGTAHSTTLTGLIDGQSYTWYVRCQDPVGNANVASFSITFSVASPADVTPPTISNGQPSGTLAAGTTQAVMSVVTNEAASCRWGTSATATYGALPNAFGTTGGTSHSTLLTGLTDGQSYAHYVRCQDAAGNANGTAFVIGFSVASPVDATPPVISGGAPSGTLAAGTTQTTMSVVTNEPASCRWGTSSTAAYADLANPFTTTGGTAHATTLTGLVDGQSYGYYVRCQDAAANANASSYAISFSVATPADVTAPVISGGTPSGTLAAGTTQATMQVTTSEAASCRWGAADVVFASLPNAFATTGGTAHSTTLTGLVDGQSYTYYVRCQDQAGNTNATSAVIGFSIAVPADVAPPVISNPLPSGTLPAGTSSTVMSVTTNEAASCRWGTSSSTTYANLPNPFTTTGGTSHSTTLTGLANGQSYTRFVRCQDAAGNANGSSAVISFSIAAPTVGSIVLSPPSITLEPGETQQFGAVVRDTEGQILSVTVAWSATGGTISSGGLYTAGGAGGQYRVIGSAGTVADTSEITIEVPSGTGPVLTRVNTVFLLDGVPITRFGLRTSNALQSDEITQRLIDAMPDMRDHGMQSFSITIQGGRHEDGGNSAFNGFNPDGTLKPEIVARLTAILDASAQRNMVPVVVLFYQGRDQELSNETAVRNAVTQTMSFLLPWRHAWVNVINEPNHTGFDHAILSTSSGQAEIYELAKSVDPARIVYVSEAQGANDGFRSDTWGRAGIGTSMPAGSVCIEYDRFDEYSSPGIFSDGERSTTIDHANAAFAIPAYFFYHASWHQKADAAGWPRFDKGGAGTSADPGVSFIWNRMRELAGVP